MLFTLRPFSFVVCSRISPEEAQKQMNESLYQPSDQKTGVGLGQAAVPCKHTSAYTQFFIVQHRVYFFLSASQKPKVTTAIYGHRIR